jgi:hypothetical protein
MRQNCAVFSLFGQNIEMHGKPVMCAEVIQIHIACGKPDICSGIHSAANRFWRNVVAIRRQITGMDRQAPRTPQVRIAG